IFGANTLSLRLHYLYVPLVPGMRSFLRQLGRALPDADFAAQAMRRAGALPIRQTMSVTMQSSAWDWQHGGRIAPAARPPGPAAAMPTDTAARSPPCSGIWCDRPWAGRSWQPMPSTPLSPRLPATPAGSGPFPWDDTEKACQAALCCVG